MTQDEFMELMQVKLNNLQVARNIAEQNRKNVQAMRLADTAGFSCIVEACLNKADFINHNGKQMFCESHMLIGAHA